ncbi:hypothetical protein EBZ39_07675 [bacterium]|nr:hypothetical protein [bacterium]
MKKYEKQRPSMLVVVDVFCDVCEKSCKTPINDYEYAKLKAVWGYSSRKDGTTCEMELCEDCFDDVVKHISTLKAQKRESNKNE